jgi:hypothetical protein
MSVDNDFTFQACRYAQTGTVMVSTRSELKSVDNNFTFQTCRYAQTGTIMVSISECFKQWERFAIP